MLTATSGTRAFPGPHAVPVPPGGRPQLELGIEPSQLRSGNQLKQLRTKFNTGFGAELRWHTRPRRPPLQLRRQRQGRLPERHTVER